MYSISDLKVGTIISYDNQPYVITTAQHIKVARGGANVKTKLKNLINGTTLDKTFNGSDKINEADIERSKANFLYSSGTSYSFMDNNTYEQFELEKEVIGMQADFLKDGQTVDVMLFKNKPVSIKLPVKVELKVIESPPGVKGDTAGSANKMITLETDKEIRAPLFINQNDIIRVNTETGEYVERV